MNDFSGDEPPKFVITPRSCRLPDELLVASLSQRHCPNPGELQWSHRSHQAPSQPRELQRSPFRSSPRQRRVMLQQASPQSPSSSLQDASSPNAITRSFPEEWGSPPSKLSPVKTRLPEGYGIGSATVRSWMIHRMHGAAAGGAAAGIYDTGSDLTTTLPQQNEAEAAGISAWTRSVMRHPDVPWAPDGGSWPDFKVKTELDRQRRRQQREADGKSALLNPSLGSLVPPIVPPLLLEPLRDLLDTKNGRAATPASTRHLLHRLQMCKSREQHFKRGAGEAVGASVDEGVGSSVVAQRQTLELLAPAAHAAALTQHLMRLSSLNKRFKELCALSADEKETAAAIMKQRAQVVQELRRQNQNRFQRRANLLAQAKQPAHHEHAPFSPQLPSLSTPPTGEAHLLPNSQHLNRPAAHAHGARQTRPRASSAITMRQRSWITAVVTARAAVLLTQIVWSGKIRRADALKRQHAAVVIQKLFRWKLMPYYVRQLVNSVAILKPWMTSALLRWRCRRLNRSADILRQTLINSMHSNKIFLCIRAFRRKVILLQRNIRSFLSCTRARVVRLLKLLLIQVVLMLLHTASKCALKLSS
jgi:hypothetical protein